MFNKFKYTADHEKQWDELDRKYGPLKGFEDARKAESGDDQVQVSQNNSGHINIGEERGPWRGSIPVGAGSVRWRQRRPSTAGIVTFETISDGVVKANMGRDTEIELTRPDGYKINKSCGFSNGCVFIIRPRNIRSK